MRAHPLTRPATPCWGKYEPVPQICISACKYFFSIIDFVCPAPRRCVWCGAVLQCGVVWQSQPLPRCSCLFLRCFICRRFSTGTVGREIAPTNSKRQTPNACHRLMNIHKYATAETSSCPSEIVPREIKSNCYSTLRLLAASVGGELYANICPGRKN